MDVCILSMQRVDNYGSVLQSYILKEILEELGTKVFFLDIETNTVEKRMVRKTLIISPLLTINKG